MEAEHLPQTQIIFGETKFCPESLKNVTIALEVEKSSFESLN